MTKFRRLCFHVLCGFVPSKHLRKKLRIYARTYNTIDEADLYYRKAVKLLKNRDKIENLVLGASHGLHGFVERDDRDLNLALASQDLYYSAGLYEKYGHMQNLKNVFLFYFAFSAGHELERTGEKEACVSYRLFFGIPYKTPCLAFKNGLLKLEKNIIKNASFAPELPDVSSDYTDMVYIEPLTDEVLKNRVNGHMKNALRGNNQNFYLERMIKKAAEFGHRLYIVIPPVTEKYRALMPPFEEAFKPLELSLEKTKGERKGVEVLNFYADTDFSVQDFNDFDHLNRQGAEKLTAKIQAAAKE